MKRYCVVLPIVGTATVEVEADDEKSAIEAALDTDMAAEGDVTWEAMDRVVRGNVFYGPRSTAEATLIDDEDDA